MQHGGVHVVQTLPKTSRKMRTPTHNWSVRAKPFVIQPICIAPVLPGETLKNIMFQARVVTDPIRNPVIGWWKEYYWFYVKIRDLPATERATLIDMFINPTTATTGLHTAAKTDTYHGDATSIDYVNLCLTAVTERFFRDEGESRATAELNNMPLAKAEGPGWMDSLVDTTTLPDGGAIAGGSTAEETNRLLDAYQYLRSMNFIDMTFEDYCRSYGVNIPQEEEEHVPELIRYVKEWSYPVNHVEPTTGVPASAVSWAVRERVDKDRFFKEPGFIFGVTVTRPKVYFSRQLGNTVDQMGEAFNWLPALMRDNPETSLKELANNAGHLSTPTNGYWFDFRDLLLYGDQFVNFSLAATDGNFVALPTVALNKRYVSSTDIDNLFADLTTPDALVREDGTARISILGGQTDQT